MTEKEIENLAEAMKLNKPGGDAMYGQWRDDVYAIVDTCLTNCCRFDRLQFLRACGVIQ